MRLDLARLRWILPDRLDMADDYTWQLNERHLSRVVGRQSEHTFHEHPKYKRSNFKLGPACLQVRIQQSSQVLIRTLLHNLLNLHDLLFRRPGKHIRQESNLIDKKLLAFEAVMFM